MKVACQPLGLNFCQVGVDGLTYFFSYNTCVAFRDATGRLYVSATDAMGQKWSNTTRKHLNTLTGGRDVPYAEWAQRLALAEAAGVGE